MGAAVRTRGHEVETGRSLLSREELDGTISEGSFESSQVLSSATHWSLLACDHGVGEHCGVERLAS
jgi:hypothetical protein